MDPLWVTGLVIGIGIVIVASILGVLERTISKGTGNLSLVVVDENDSPIAGATVTINDEVVSQTDSRGIFTTLLYVGSYLIEVNAPNPYRSHDPTSYHPWQKEITVRTDTPMTYDVILEGWSSLSTTWHNITDAAQDSLNGTPSTATVTFSFTQGGTPVGHAGSLTTTEVPDPHDNSVSFNEFKEEIVRAFEVLKEGLEAAVPGLTVNFVHANGSPCSVSGYSPCPTEPTQTPFFEPYVARTMGIGDIRVGMYNMQDGSNSMTLAYAYSPGSTNQSEAGDILFNTQANWRLDSHAGSSSDYSILRVAIHELLHSIGIGHNVNPNSLMAPVVGGQDTFSHQFGGSLTSSIYEINALRGTYGRLL